ncbi:sigma-70 family RNA polymerase sigma factor [Candidatus Pacearchaeota archaeon]|nr:sigma-70 family RNA polymerase sigma factor [Candidatus Pacearchaeota archaeon]
MAKILKRKKGKSEIIEVKPKKKEKKEKEISENIADIEKGNVPLLTEFETVYQTLYNKVSNSYNSIEQNHGQYEFDKFDILQETFAVIQDHINKGMTFDNLEHYAKRVFSNMTKKYHRKFVKPLNSDCCFVEFNTDKMTMIDEKNPDTNYLEQSTIDRRHYVKTIIKALKPKDRKLFALYHCKELNQKALQEKMVLSQQAVSIKIKRLNYKIIGICKKFKIDTLLNKAFAMPTWKHESLKGKWLQKYDLKPCLSQDSHLDSQINNKGLSFETPLNLYSPIGNSFNIKTKLPVEIPVKEKEIQTIQKGKRNYQGNGFFANTSNQTRLMKLIESNILNFGSDIFNSFYSKKSLFDYSVQD